MSFFLCHPYQLFLDASGLPGLRIDARNFYFNIIFTLLEHVFEDLIHLRPFSRSECIVYFFPNHLTHL